MHAELIQPASGHVDPDGHCIILGYIPVPGECWIGPLPFH